MKKCAKHFGKLPWSKAEKAVVLTGIMMIFSVFLLAMGNLLVRPIQKNYQDLLVQNQKIEMEYLAEGAWTYFAQQWKGGKIHLGSSFRWKKKNIIKKQRGWFRLEALLQKPKSDKRFYRFSIWSGLFVGERPGPIIVEGAFQVEGTNLKLMVWNWK